MVDSPSGGAPTKAPRWDLADTEGYGGGNSFSWSLLMFSGTWVYIVGRSRSLDARGAYEGGGRAGHPRGRLDCFMMSAPSLLDCVCSKKISPEGFIPFDIPFLRNPKIGKKKTTILGWASI